MDKYSHIRLSDDLINLTDQKVCVYESSSGEIREFPPSDLELPSFPIAVEAGQPTTHYILSREMAQRVKQSGRRLDDIAIVKNASLGRNGATITYLVWGMEPETRLELYDRACELCVQHK
ncbi:hypothetical protein IJJ49_02595 [Candidatus Saccharibacteria bacterium]|nr:hypothetical protein [Candidatus Saccharibacteria bacterium]